MKSKRKVLLALITGLALAGCNKGNKDNYFTYSNHSFTNTIGEGVNNDTFDYNSLKVNPISNLRDDFAMGVDASMVDKVEELGGVYFNEEGKEQDVFEIMALNGVNFFRVRIWNNPENFFGSEFGGGSVDVERAIKMAKRAARVNMNIMVDLHYSDFWADPASQRTPTTWASHNIAALETAVETFTKETLQAFKDEGLSVHAVQIGNEINNGLLFPIGKINWADTATSFATVSRLLKAGIKGAKSVYSDILSVIHLADGGSYDVFDAFFTAMQTNNVNYDIIGASYYPYYHGTLNSLQNNLNQSSAKFNKPVIVAEMSYGFTVESHQHAANIYNAQMEDSGNFKTSIQGQATAIHDVVEIIANVPNKMGLGLFYWEPAWLPIEGASWATAEGQAWTETGDANTSSVVENFTDGKSTWANQALFNYNGRMLPSLKTFALLKGKQAPSTEEVTKARTTSITITLNSAINEKMPETYLMETNFDAVRPYPVVWDATESAKTTVPGTYVVPGVVLGEYQVTANVTVTENFVVDPSFENQGATDQVLAPWTVSSETHSSDPNKVIKLNRKSGDVLHGTTSLNWYHGSEVFHFKLEQEISLNVVGDYTFRSYLMGIAPGEIPHTLLDLYVINTDGTKHVSDMKDTIRGWGTVNTYDMEGNIPFNVAQAGKIKIGLEGRGQPGAWGHADQFFVEKV